MSTDDLREAERRLGDAKAARRDDPDDPKALRVYEKARDELQRLRAEQRKDRVPGIVVGGEG
jgi:hypothetical protein